MFFEKNLSVLSVVKNPRLSEVEHGLHGWSRMGEKERDCYFGFFRDCRLIFWGKNVVTTMIAQKMQENRVWVSLTARRRELGLAARRLARFSSMSGTTGYS